MVEIEYTRDGFRGQVNACLEHIDNIDSKLVAYLKETAPPVDLFALRVLLREAMLNAVVHGAGKDPEQWVWFEVMVSGHAVEIVVEDNGPGFPWRGRETSFDITGDGGRGLPLMQMYASSVTFSAKGNRVTLRKDFEPEVHTEDAPGNSAMNPGMDPMELEGGLLGTVGPRDHCDGDA